MPADLPATLATPLLDSGITLQASLAAATTAAPSTATFTIRKNESIAKLKGIKTTPTQYIIPFAAVSVSDPTNACIQMLLNVNVDKLPTGFEPWKEWTASIASTVPGLMQPATNSCIVEKARPNINWKLGARNPAATVTINKKFLDALRAAIPGDLVFTVAIGGGVANPPPSGEEEDK